MNSEVLDFKRGSPYSRKDIGNICYPGVGRPTGGSWDTSYVSFKNNLIVFMNIGVPGTTGHNFDNQFDHQTNTIIWYGKPNTHSKQPTFQKLFSKKLTPHFFARWDTKNLKFIYLGIGSIVKFEDGVQTKHGSAIRLVLTCEDAKDILDYSMQLENEDIHYPAMGIAEPLPHQELIETPSSFLLEKHLEDYIEKNWETTVFGKDYSIYENGRQFPTETGPLDILAQRKDKKGFLILELKRDKASDVVVGQTLRYMGYIKKTLVQNDEDVRGCIIATKEDQGLRHALSVAPNIDFYRYKINFSLDRVEF